MKVTIIGIELVKTYLQVHGVDEHGKVIYKKQLKHDQMPAGSVWKLAVAPIPEPTSGKGWGIQ